MARKRRSREEWTRLIDQLAATGEAPSQFARRRRLNESTLSRTSLMLPTSASVLTPAEALEGAEEQSYELRLEALDIEASRAEWHEDIDLGAPTARLGVKDLEIGGSSPEWEAALRLPLPRPWDLASSRPENRDGNYAASRPAVSNLPRGQGNHGLARMRA